MKDKEDLYEASNGSALRGYLLIKERGANVPPSWAERTQKSRENREEEVKRILKQKDLLSLKKLEEWEYRYKKECFYRGITRLLQLERSKD